jgi:hypothetical protein
VKQGDGDAEHAAFHPQPVLRLGHLMPAVEPGKGQRAVEAVLGVVIGRIAAGVAGQGAGVELHKALEGAAYGAEVRLPVLRLQQLADGRADRVGLCHADRIGNVVMAAAIRQGGWRAHNLCKA